MHTVLGTMSELSYTPDRLSSFGCVHWVDLWIVEHDAGMDFASVCVIVGLGCLGAGGMAGVGGVARVPKAVCLVHIPVLFLSRLGGINDRAGVMPRLQIVALSTRWGVEVPVVTLTRSDGPSALCLEANDRLRRIRR